VKEPINRVAFQEIRNRAERLKALYGKRDEMAEEFRRMYHMEWKERPEADWIKPTMSPTAYNTITGAVRLMVSTDPQFNVSTTNGDDVARTKADRMEAAAGVIWSGSSEIAGRPLHYEMVLSSLLNAEVIGYQTRTADLLEYAQATGRRGLINRATEAASVTPYLLQAYNPAYCYTERDMLGVSAVMRCELVPWADLVAMYGQGALDAMGTNRTDQTVTVYEWYDWEYRCVWTDGSADPILMVETGDVFPVVSAITDGSLLWKEPHRQRTPFLYALAQSKIWQRENLALTVIYSLMHGIGSNPLLVHETDDADDLVIDRTIPGGVLKIHKGDRIGPLSEKILDPSQLQGWQMAQGISEASTIPSVALGAAPSGSMAFSAISLLSQTGRLPLIGTRNGVGGVAAQLMKRALRSMKLNNDGRMYSARSGLEIALAPDDIPDRVPMECVLEVSLPQDKLQMANAAVTLKREKMAPLSWIQENVLGIGQTGKVQKQMMSDQLLEFMVEEFMRQTRGKNDASLQQALANMQQMQQAQMQGGADAMAAGIENQVPQGGPLPQELNSSSGVYPPGGVQPGAPLAGPLPARGAA